MYRDQLICIVTPLDRDSGDAVRTLVEASAMQLRGLFGKLEQVHFASLSLLPPRPRKRRPSLALELVLDEGVSLDHLIERLVDAGFHYLWPVYANVIDAPADETPLRQKAWLRRKLKSHAHHAHGGYVGTRDRTVEQINREGALFKEAKLEVAKQGNASLSEPPRVRSQVARAIASTMQAAPLFSDMKEPAARSPWRDPRLGPAKRVLRILTHGFDDLLPAPLARPIAVVLVLATLIVALGGAGVFALMVAALVVGWDTIFGGTAFFGSHWVIAPAVSIAYLIALATLLALAILALSGGILSVALALIALKGLLILAAIVLIKNAFGISFDLGSGLDISYVIAAVIFLAWRTAVSAFTAWRPAAGILAAWSSIIGLLAAWSVPIGLLAIWGAAAALYVGATLAGVVILMVAAILVVRPDWGLGVLIEFMVLVLLAVFAVLGPLGASWISIALLALTIVTTAAFRIRSYWKAASIYARRSVFPLGALAVFGMAVLWMMAHSIPWVASRAYGIEQFWHQRSIELTAVFSESHQGYSSFGLIAALWIAGFLAGAVLLTMAGSWTAKRVSSTIGRLNRPGEETWRTQLAKWSRRTDLDGQPSMLSAVLEGFEQRQTSASPRYQQTHPALVKCEGSLRNRCNHMVSVTELRPPYVYHAWKLRFWLWVVGHLGDRWWAEGTLGHARGIHFAHWHVIDGGRRLLFLSNYDGDFSGYLDEFILGALGGINLIWGRSRLLPRLAAAQGHPSIEASRDFPPRRAVFFAGCANEQWFKAYVRDSMVPHLFRFEAYRYSCSDIERATRLRDALPDPRDQVRDDQIMRAIES